MNRATEIKSKNSYNQVEILTLNQAEGRVSHCEFIACTFQNCLLARSEFKDSRFVDCKFLDCDLSLVDLEGSSFTNVEFRSSKVLGVDWTKANWENRLGTSLKFVECAMDHSTFIGLELVETAFINCRLVGVDFREADLTRADFSDSDLSESLFLNTRLEGADFRSARNYDIHPAQNQLKGARFSVPEVFSLLHNLDIELGNGDLGEIREA